MPDESEFVTRAEPFRRELLAHCYRMLGGADEAQDLVQETYLRAWRSYGAFEGLGGPSEDPYAPPDPAEPDVAWLQPIPDTLVTSESEDPATIVAAREGLRLALIASLQFLPARQRAVFILREVLGFRATEVASMLDTTTVAVKSALQRARARLDQATAARAQVSEPTEPHARALLDEYIAGFEYATRPRWNGPCAPTPR